MFAAFWKLDSGLVASFLPLGSNLSFGASLSLAMGVVFRVKLDTKPAAANFVLAGSPMWCNVVSTKGARA
jgi:hypothetical protein